MAIWARVSILIHNPDPADMQRAYAAADYRGYMRARLRDFRTRGATFRADSGYGLAVQYLGLGEKRQALDALRLGFEQREPPMIILKVDPVFDPLRADPGFQELERRIGLLP